MTTIDINKEQLQKMKSQPGFIAALDQSGGSTPHALSLYGIKDHSWTDDDEMFAIITKEMGQRMGAWQAEGGHQLPGAEQRRDASAS